MRLKIMEYNVQDLFLHLAYPVEPADLQTLNESQWQYFAREGVGLKPLAKLRAIADLIRQESPDIVGLTEVGGRESLETFLKLFLPDLYTAFVTDGQTDRGIENAFLVRTELAKHAFLKSHRDWNVAFRYPHEIDPDAHHATVLAAEYAQLGLPDERALSRDIPLLMLKPAKGIPCLALLLVHLKSGLDAIGFDPEGKLRRAAEFKALLEIAASVDTKTPLVIMGDFNGNASRAETAEEFQPLYQQTDWDDVLEIAKVPPHERYTHVSWVARKIQTKQLDYIFLRGALKRYLRPEGTKVYRYRFAGDDGQEMMVPFTFRERAQLPSDHYPLLCELDIPVSLLERIKAFFR